MYDRNCFVTLTYEKAPVGLQLSDVQMFMKKLSRYAKRGVRYFHAGECCCLFLL